MSFENPYSQKQLYKLNTVENVIQLSSTTTEQYVAQNTLKKNIYDSNLHKVYLIENRDPSPFPKYP